MSDVSWMADKKNKLRRMMEHARTRVSGERRVIVTLTSYPPRMNTIWMTLRSILASHGFPIKLSSIWQRVIFPIGKPIYPIRSKRCYGMTLRFVG